MEAIKTILREKNMIELAEYVGNLKGLDETSVKTIFRDVNEKNPTDGNNLDTAIGILKTKMADNREAADLIAGVSQQQQFSVSEQSSPQYHSSSSLSSSLSLSSPPPAPRSVPQTSTGIVVNVDGSKVSNPKEQDSDTHIKYLVHTNLSNGPKWGIVEELTGISGGGITPDKYFVITNADENLANADTLYEKVDTGIFKVAGSFNRTNTTINIDK